MDAELLAPLLEFLQQGGLLAGAILIIFGLFTNQLYSKKEFEAMQAERDECRDELRELQRDRRRR